jgi:hypothetical protein
MPPRPELHAASPRPTGVHGIKGWLAVSLGALLAACADASSAGHSGFAHIVGTVTAGPTCPVERVGTPCPDRPVAGASVRAVLHSSVVATSRTDSAGMYRLNVKPGAYTIVATNAGAYPSTAQRAVSVVVGQQATVDLVLDTGIR